MGGMIGRYPSTVGSIQYNKDCVERVGFNSINSNQWYTVINVSNYKGKINKIEIFVDPTYLNLDYIEMQITIDGGTPQIIKPSAYFTKFNTSWSYLQYEYHTSTEFKTSCLIEMRYINAVSPSGTMRADVNYNLKV